MTVETKLGIVFPGQGSQSIGMMDDLVALDASLQSIFDTASSVLGYDLWKIICAGPASALNRTQITQPALLASGYAAWMLWNKRTAKQPAVLAGHSLGEYTALVCAGVIDFEDGINLVAERGRCMQDAVPVDTGAMAAILGLDDERVAELCQHAAYTEIVSVANFNSPGQVVIAGHKTAVERAMTLAKAAGAKRALSLPVSVPSHCMLMREAADEFARVMQNTRFNNATIPVIQNVDAQARTRAGAIQEALVEQLYKPVRWVSCIEAMRQRNIGRIIECGPGNVLTGLIKRIDRAIETGFIQDGKSVNNTLVA